MKQISKPKHGRRLPALITPLSDPSRSEQTAIVDANQRQAKRRSPATVKLSAEAGGAVRVGSPHADQDGWSARQREAFGTASADFAATEISRLMNVVQKTPLDQQSLNAAIAVVEGIGPQSEVEAMLASQMAATHVLTMDMMRIARKSELVPQIEMAGNLAVKLARTFTAQIEALAKLRRGGEQTVRVEHVHVHAGGQAVVGSVTHTTLGGGGSDESGRQPHAPGELRALALAPGSPVWSEDAERETVPITGGDG